MVTISRFKERLRRYGKSLRLRLFVILLLVGILPLNVLKIGVLSSYEKQAVKQRADQVRSQCRLIADQLLTSGYLNGSQSDVIDSEVRMLGTLYSGRVVVLNSNFRIVLDTYGIDTDKVLIAQEVLEAFSGEETSNYNSNEQFLEVTVPVRDENTQKTSGMMIIAVPTTDIREGRGEISGVINLMQIVLVLLLIGVAFYLTRLLVRPFGKVTARLENDDQFLEEDISIPDYTETQMLAEAYNRMRRRLKEQEDSRQEFVSNVSHELKTPLASMKVLADSLTTQESVPNEVYREFMTDMSSEIDRENQIINDLLSLVKMNRKSPDINIRETNINEMIDLILKRLRPIADKNNIELVLEDYKPIVAEVDETKLTLAITNLVENAIKYNKPNGWVHVSLNMDSSFFFIKVEDSGIGIPEESQPYIFERFYRVDKSHSREIGGTGLGLAITQQAVLMHHGAIRVYSKPGEGTTFTVRIPMKYQAWEEKQEDSHEADE